MQLLVSANCGLCLPVTADVIEIPATRDATLYESAAGETASGSGPFLFVGKNLHGTLDRYRSVLYFDVSAVPVGVQITDVSLRMYMSRTIAGATDVTLHAVTNAWGEGSSVAFGNGGAGANSEAGDATWLHASYPGTLWTSPGGDFAAATLSTASINDVGLYMWPSSASMVQIVTQWIASPAQNSGLMVKGDENAGGTAKRFDSRENTVAANWPTLVITYTSAACPADFNGDGFLDFTDFDAFVGAFEAGTPDADFNGDGFLDFTDFDAFVSAFEIGC
jgi:hypothetical protein